MVKSKLKRNLSFKAEALGMMLMLLLEMRLENSSKPRKSYGPPNPLGSLPHPSSPAAVELQARSKGKADIHVAVTVRRTA